jgi:hypothetical protein
MVRTTSFLLALMLATAAAAQTSETNCNTYVPGQINCQTTSQPPANQTPATSAPPRSSAPFADGVRRGQEMAARQQMQKQMQAGNCKAAFDIAVKAMLFDDARQIREFCPAAQ